MKTIPGEIQQRQIYVPRLGEIIYYDLRFEQPKIWLTIALNSWQYALDFQPYQALTELTDAVLKKLKMIPVILESPYAGDVEKNLKYARDCMRDSLARGEAPFASHLLYTQVLDDAVFGERAQGIGAGYTWMALAAKVVVYKDLGISEGMLRAIEQAGRVGKEIEYRTIFNKVCSQEGCKNPIMYEYMWPGEDIAYICTVHAPKLVQVANALGFNLHLNETNSGL